MSRIVKLSEAATIGFHSMVIIARSKELVNANRLSELTGASRNHIAKVLQRLVKANFLTSSRGSTGGFILNKKPQEITILDIYEAIEGKVETKGCPMQQTVCPFEKCLIGCIVKQVSNDLIGHFKNQTLKDYL